jgi:hypothetical protein
MSERPELERRYRKLVIWFPAEHRLVHGDEVTGVLMAGAPPDRTRPGIGETLDLIRGAMLIRLRPGRALSDRDGWRDAVAVFSVAGPVLLFTAVCLSYWGDYKWNGFPSGLSGSLLDLALYGQALVVPVVLLGQRSMAFVAARAQLLLVVVTSAHSVRYLASVRTAPSAIGSFWVSHAIAGSCCLVVIALAEVVALAVSRGSPRGRSLLRTRHWVFLGFAAIPAALLSPTFDFYIRARATNDQLSDHLVVVVPAFASAALVVLLLAAWMSSAAGKRLAVLFGVLSYPYLVATWNAYGITTWSAQTAGAASAPAVLICCTAAFALLRSVRARHAGSGPQAHDEGRGSDRGRPA